MEKFFVYTLLGKSMGAPQVIIFGLVLLFFNVECSQPRASCLMYDEETLTLVKNYTTKVKLKVDCAFKGLRRFQIPSQ